MRRGYSGDSLRIVTTLLSSYKDDGEKGALLGIFRLSQSRWLQRAGIEASWVYYRCVAVGVLAVIAGSLCGKGVGVAVFVSGIVVIRFAVACKIRKRREEVDRDLPALVTSLASSVRAGIDPLSALIAAQEYFPPTGVVNQEIGAIRRGLHQGRHEEELIEGFLSLFGHQDGELLKRCLILSRRHGSPLAEPLHRVTRVIRQRQSFRRKTRAALAMHRMSVVGIALCACVIALIQVGLNAPGLAIAIHNPIASKILIIGGTLMVTGLWWMMSMGLEEVK